jgi:hypothetical protein
MTEREGGEQSGAEQDLDASRERLRETERRAEEQVVAAERLAERAAELEEREERIRRSMHEPTGPLLPPLPADET